MKGDIAYEKLRTNSPSIFGGGGVMDRFNCEVCGRFVGSNGTIKVIDRVYTHFPVGCDDIIEALCVAHKEKNPK